MNHTLKSVPPVYYKMVWGIIKHQEKIVGPVAWILAKKVIGLIITSLNPAGIKIADEPKQVIDELVGKYEYLFGRLGILECRSAVNDIITDMHTNDVPHSLC